MLVTSPQNSRGAEGKGNVALKTWDAQLFSRNENREFQGFPGLGGDPSTAAPAQALRTGPTGAPGAGRSPNPIPCWPFPFSFCSCGSGAIPQSLLIPRSHWSLGKSNLSPFSAEDPKKLLFNADLKLPHHKAFSRCLAQDFSLFPFCAFIYSVKDYPDKGQEEYFIFKTF